MTLQSSSKYLLSPFLEIEIHLGQILTICVSENVDPSFALEPIYLRDLHGDLKRVTDLFHDSTCDMLYELDETASP